MKIHDKQARIIIILIILAMIVLYTWSFRVEAQTPMRYIQYTVQQGDTLWDIVHKQYTDKPCEGKQYSRHYDRRKIIYDIQKKNEINTLLEIGQVIMLPDYAEVD